MYYLLKIVIRFCLQISQITFVLGLDFHVMVEQSALQQHSFVTTELTAMMALMRGVCVVSLTMQLTYATSSEDLLLRTISILFLTTTFLLKCQYMYCGVVTGLSFDVFVQ